MKIVNNLPEREYDYAQQSDADAALLADLAAGERANPHAAECKVCTALTMMSDPVREGVERALAGTIGGEKLAAILDRNGYPTGRRAIRRHRTEGHNTP